MTNIEALDKLAVFEEIKVELDACDNDADFNECAADLCREYEWPLKIVKAVGKGLLTTDRESSADFIRTYLGEVELGSDEYENRATWLENFLGVSRRSLGATLAHKKIGSKRTASRKPPVLKKVRTKVNLVLSDQDKGFIYTYVNAATNKQEKTKRREEMAGKYNVKVGSIPALMAHVTMKARAACTDIVETFFDVPLAEPIESATNPTTQVTTLEADFSVLPTVETFENDEVIDPSPKALAKSSESSDGAHIEYDNDVKNKWRKAVAEKIVESISEAKRAKMKVLCLPGKDWVEVTQIYLALGFKPENIYGVEREPSVRDNFEAFGETLGCNAYFGTLDDFLEENDIPFNFVSLDFLGPLGDDKFKLLRALKLSKKAYVLVNYMAQREKSGLQQSYAFRDDLETRNRGVETLLGTLDVEAVVNHQGTEFSLSDQRGVESQNSLRAALGGLGKIDRENYMSAAERIMARLVETGKVDEVVQFMLDKINQERSSISKEVGNGALNQEFEARVKDLNFKTEVLKQPLFLINYIRYVLHKNLSLPQSEIRKYLNFEDSPEMQVAPQIIEGAIADMIASQLMPIWQSFVTGTAKQTEILGAWDYRAYRNRFHSDLIAVEDSRAFKQWQNNTNVKQLVGLAFKIMFADLNDRPVQLGSTEPKQAIRGRKLTDIPPAMVVMVDDVSVALPGDLLKKLLSKLQASPGLVRSQIT